MATQQIFVLGTDGNLWLETGGPFGQIPPPRVQVDGNVNRFFAVDKDEIYVLGSDGNLWHEHAPFGTVPLPPCSQTSGFGKGFGCRDLVYSNVDAFGVFPDAGGVFVIDGNLNLWQLGTPPVQVDGNVIDFQPLSPEQAMFRTGIRNRKGRSVARPVRVKGSSSLPPNPRKRA